MEETIKDRIYKAMVTRNIKATELAKLTGLSKASISYYLSGKFIPKQTAIYLISQALHVSPSWLLGFDVPMEKQSDELENKLIKLDNYMEKNNLDNIALIPVYDNINLRTNWKTTPVGYTPLDFKINGCSEDKNYFYYKIDNNSMNIEQGTYILIEDTQDVNVNDLILYSTNNHIELGIYKLSLEQEQNFKILGKYIK